MARSSRSAPPRPSRARCWGRIRPPRCIVPAIAGRRWPPAHTPSTRRRRRSVDRLRVLYIGPHPPSPIAVRPWLFLRAMEQRHQVDVVAVTQYRPTVTDRLAAPRHPPAPVSVLHTPGDLDRFRPRLRRSPNTVVFTGKMSFHANRVAAEWLCDEIWPRVRARHPEARLLLAGARPPRSLLRRRAGDVSVTGYVPDLRALIAGAAVAVAPLRYAVGVQNKVLEAMACATPVVTTSAAVGDLGFNEGGHGFIADDAAAFAERICWLLDDHRLAGQMGRAGREYVERHHAIGPLAEQLDQYYQQRLTTQSTRPIQREVEAI